MCERKRWLARDSRRKREKITFVSLFNVLERDKASLSDGERIEGSER